MEIKENCLYWYDKGRGWRKHGIVYTIKYKDEMYAIDTYWDSEFQNRGEATSYDAYKIADDLKFIMSIDDAKQVKKDEFDLYDERDKLWIPDGGLHERYLVNKNASKRVDYIIYDLKRKIQSAEYQIEHLQRKIVKYRKELSKYE